MVKPWRGSLIYDQASVGYDRTIEYLNPTPTVLGTAGNPVNPTKDMEIPIAILSSSDFYAPLMLSSVTQEPLAWFGVLQHPLNLMALGFDPKVKDVNGDGLRDLVVKFRVAETRIVCGGPTRVFLRGLTDAGIPVQSVGTITLKGCK